MGGREVRSPFYLLRRRPTEDVCLGTHLVVKLFVFKSIMVLAVV